MSLTMTDTLVVRRVEMAGRFLTFALGRKTYGVPVLRVREIVRLPDITPVPGVPAYVKGVINLRGKVLPVIDLRLRFDFAEVEFTDRNCVVVVQVSRSDGGYAPVGLIVDAVEEIAQVTADDLEPAPEFGRDINTDHVVALARLKRGVLTLLDIDKIISADAGEELEDAA
jgi:purine-binding chemotaxis protein CheW